MNKTVQCPKCGHNKLLLATVRIDTFFVDKEPYESGVQEEGEIMQGEFTTVEDIYIGIQYCEKCDSLIHKWFED